MPSPHSGKNRVAVVVTVYLLAYFLASLLDLSTTALALQTSGAHEGNTFVTSAQSYLTLRAWAITVAGGLIMSGCVVFAVRNAQRAEEVWLQHPVRSFALFYINPW